LQLPLVARLQTSIHVIVAKNLDEIPMVREDQVAAWHCPCL
jgi:hypothetical protein